MPKYKFNCEICGKEYERYHSKSVRIPKNKFCTVKCQAIWFKDNPSKPKKGIYVKCCICEKELYVFPGDLDMTKSKPLNERVCSNECKYKLAKIKGTFSGKNCNFYKNGIRKKVMLDTYGLNWIEIRNKNKIKYNHKCDMCGSDKNLQTHHIIDYRKFNKDYDMMNNDNNLVCLCPSCHMKVHRYMQRNKIDLNINDNSQLWYNKIKQSILNQP